MLFFSPVGSALAASVCKKITGRLTSAIAKQEDVSVQLEALDIMADMLCRYTHSNTFLMRGRRLLLSIRERCLSVLSLIQFSYYRSSGVFLEALLVADTTYLFLSSKIENGTIRRDRYSLYLSWEKLFNPEADQS